MYPPGDRDKDKRDMVPTLKKHLIYLGFILYIHEPNIRIKASYKFFPITYFFLSHKFKLIFCVKGSKH